MLLETISHYYFTIWTFETFSKVFHLNSYILCRSVALKSAIIRFNCPLSNWLTEWCLPFPSPHDVIRPRPLRALALCGMPWSRVRCGHGRRRRFCGWVPCTDCRGQRNESELNPTVKIETRHPYIGRSVIVAELWRPVVACRWKFLRIFCVFGKKTTPWVKFSKLCSERFHRDTDRPVVCKFREIWPTEVVRCLPDKNQNVASLSSSRYCAYRAENLQWLASNNVLRVL